MKLYRMLTHTCVFLVAASLLWPFGIGRVVRVYTNFIDK